MQNLQRIIWLASYPKSGNTWMRALLGNYLLDAPPDINTLHQFSTADVRQDFFDRAAGRPFVAGDMDDWLVHRAKVLPAIAASRPGHHFVKTHSKIDKIGKYNLIMPEVTAAAIYIMRNPFDVLPSYARHLSLGIDEALERMLDPKALNATDTRIFEIIGRWDDHVASWRDARGLPLHIMRYEDLLANTEAEIRRLFAFLQMPVKDGQLRRAIRAASFKNLQKQEREKGFKERPQGMQQFFATGTSGGWREALSRAQIAKVRAEFLPTLERHYPEILAETAAYADAAS